MAPIDNGDDGSTTFLPQGWDATPSPAAEALGHYLVAIEGAAAGKIVEVGDEPVTIGRSPQHVLSFAGDSDVSRAHAKVSLINGVAVAEDLGSTNGTFLDSKRLTAPAHLKEGSMLRLGKQLLKYERHSRGDMERRRELEKSLRKASGYVSSLLPAPLTEGPVRVDWRFVPSAQLGGDAFGYYWLDADTFVFYLLDVSGHGVGSAMHSVTVLNVLRQRALPDVDFQDPAAVLASLNERFQMEDHHGMYFTMWYGVYKPAARELSYSSAGHPAAYLVSADGSDARPLGAPALMIGAMPDQSYEVQQTVIPPGSALHVFSDGAFEIVAKDDRQWTMDDFLPLLREPAEIGTRAERIHTRVRDAARPGPFDDDFSLVVVTVT